MTYQKYIARCYRVYQHERNENISFLSIFNGGGRPKWRFSNFPRFWKNSSASGSFNCIFENNSLKALFGQNMKKLKILKLSPDSRYLQKLTLKTVMQKVLVFWNWASSHLNQQQERWRRCANQSLSCWTVCPKTTYWSVSGNIQVVYSRLSLNWHLCKTDT